MSKTIKIAVQGCCHGEITKIYNQIESLPKESQPELLIVCGDFQSLRSESDLPSLNVPDKYKRLGDFHKYHSGELKAPVLTVFIGGNHEASDFLLELPYGGWVCPNIYYLGFANILWYKGLRIGGISGIYKSFDFYKAHFEKVPLRESAVKSVYHTRFEDELKLMLYPELNLNCMISHDWPVGITNYGDLKRLLKVKPFFKDDVMKSQLGSRFHWDVLNQIKPNYWFAAHLHVKFDAFVKHSSEKRRLSEGHDTREKKPKNGDEIDLGLEEEPPVKNDDEINLDLDHDEEDEEDGETKATNNDEIDLGIDLDEEVTSTTTSITASSSSSSEHPTGFSQTNFLALDKCTHRNENLQILDIPSTTPTHPSLDCNVLYYDLHFIKINKFMQEFKSSEFFKNLRWKDLDEKLLNNLKEEIKRLKAKNVDDLKIPFNFEVSPQNPKDQTKAYEDKYLT